MKLFVRFIDFVYKNQNRYQVRYIFFESKALRVIFMYSKDSLYRFMTVPINKESIIDNSAIRDESASGLKAVSGDEVNNCTSLYFKIGLRL